jgi:hypothetical protein
MVDGVNQPTEEGTPQGSPLSPLLSNVYLDDLDQELGRRGHSFVRYADDVMIYVASERAGQRVMEGISAFIEQRLKLRVNRGKSAVAWAGKRAFSRVQLLQAQGELENRSQPRGPEAGQAAPAPAHRAHLGRPDGAADRSDQPLHAGLDGLLRPR